MAFPPARISDSDWEMSCHHPAFERWLNTSPLSRSTFPSGFAQLEEQKGRSSRISSFPPPVMAAGFSPPWRRAPEAGKR